MMKRMLIVAAAMAIVASSVMAASLVKVDPVGTGTSSPIYAITNDGAYATGYDGGGTADRAFVYKVSDASVITNILAGSYMSEGHGIGYRTVGGVTELVLGGKQSSGQIGMMTSSDGGATWTRPFSSAGSAPGTAATNTIGGSGDTAWLCWSDANTQSITKVYGATPTVGTAAKASPTAIAVNGMSNTGRAVGYRKATTGTRQNCQLDYTTDGGTAAQSLFVGLDGSTNSGIASAVSGDGTAIFGQSPITVGSTTNYPYRKDVGGAITGLPLLPGTAGSVSLGYVYGASEDGNYAVGMDYVGMERAALWGNLNDPNPANWTVTDLTDLATTLGIIGDFSPNNLRRAYTMGINGSGELVIGGMGVDSAVATRGFILTIPEPATLSFLALGGLALLRRRR